MTSWRIRDFLDDDLDQAIPLWGDPATAGAAAAFGLSEIIEVVRAGQPAVVAVVGSELVGSAVALVDGSHAWIMRISLADNWRRKGIGSALLEALENRLVTRGVHRISCLFAEGEVVGTAALEHRGFNVRDGVVLYEKVEAVASTDSDILHEVGGRVLGPNHWAELGGMVREKELVERRVILPLANERLAGRVGLLPPRGIMLFGPPGTGKTTFAKGIASSLGWPFVELFPSRLAGESPAGLANALRDTFDLVGELNQVVVFIDEVEEIASARERRTVSAAHGVTNEMLKIIPSFREKDRRLLVCATNSVRAIDSAFLRHGRFDYVIPVGPPDPEARRAIWSRYLSAVPHDEIDLDAIVSASSLFTPADIEFAARRTAQAVFEGALLENGSELATTQLVLQSIKDTRPTLSPQIIEEFQQDIKDYARV